MDISDVMDRAAYCIKKSCRASDIVFLFRDGADLIERDSVVKDIRLSVEKHC